MRLRVAKMSEIYCRAILRKTGSLARVKTTSFVADWVRKIETQCFVRNSALMSAASKIVSEERTSVEFSARGQGKRG